MTYEISMHGQLLYKVRCTPNGCQFLRPDGRPTDMPTSIASMIGWYMDHNGLDNEIDDVGDLLGKMITAGTKLLQLLIYFSGLMPICYAKLFVNSNGLLLYC